MPREEGHVPSLPLVVKVAVVLTVIAGIIVVLALGAVPKAQRPHLREPSQTVSTAP